ncbi:MAG TPA: hypothetical protein VFL27_13095 [Candidatus Dormibacteraeota bacterium]|nr:hypothetical protein [Candidatus Dormibacteraeota bacterium]
MIRLLSLAAAACFVLAPLDALASTPSPSPSLDTVLAKPPSSDFSVLTSSPFHGAFSAHDWAINSSGVSASETESTLNRNGFVAGYGLAWVSTTQRRALVEISMAFTGGRGARMTLTALEASEKADASYQHANTLSGIDSYYGSHLYDSTNKVYEDGFSFTKGNDLFQVYVGSPTDNNLALATSQAKAQYDAAPDSTIPSSQWPENAQSSGSAAFNAGSLFTLLIVLVLVLGGIGVVVGLVLRSRRRPPAYAQAYGPTAAYGPQMSPDGKYWYDGQTWRDADTEVPPGAQRSSDGALWWDGRTWRSVPQSPPAPPAS